MIKKQFLKTKPVCKVTFSLPAEAASHAENVQLVGDFSRWQEDPIDMKKMKDGEFRTTIELEKGKDYHFRYLIDGKRWENDWHADKYETSSLGHVENSVVTT